MDIPEFSSYILSKIKAIPKTIKIAFISTWIIGILTHITMLTNHLINHDSVLYRQVGFGALLEQGKWFIGVVAGLRGGYCSESIQVLLSILYISIAVCLTITVLKINKQVNIVLIAGLMITFPTIFCTFSYGYGDLFFFSLMFTSIAVYLTRSFKHGYIGGILFLTISLGTYQAYISYAAGLFVLLCLCDVIVKQKPLREILFNGLKYIGVMIISVILYYIILQICLKVTGTVLSTYRGIDQMGAINLLNIFPLIRDSYLKIIAFFLTDHYGTREAHYIFAYISIVLSDLILAVWIICKTKTYRHWNYLLTAIILICISPLAIHAIAVLGQNPKTHWLMIYSFILAFILPIKLSELLEQVYKSKNEKITPKDKKRLNLTSWWVGSLSILLIINWFLLSHYAYLRLQFTDQASYAIAVEISEDIYNLPNYNSNTPVAIIASGSYDGLPILISPLDKLDNFTGILGSTFYSSPITFYAMLNNFIGMNIKSPSDQQLTQLLKTDEFNSMPFYPYAGSVKMIEGVVVVKVSNN